METETIYRFSTQELEQLIERKLNKQLAIVGMTSCELVLKEVKK
jgi:hypothetical protein